MEIEENPYFAISHCKPKPFNFNGTKVTLPNDTKLFIAKYGDHYGVYSKLDTEAFEMQDKKAFKILRLLLRVIARRKNNF